MIDLEKSSGLPVKVDSETCEIVLGSSLNTPTFPTRKLHDLDALWANEVLEVDKHKGKAVVFENNRDLLARIDDPRLSADENSVLVLKNAGPKGAPGMPEWGHLPIPAKLLKAGVKDMVRLSDARISGTSFGTIVVHISPEAAIGGPLAIVRDGVGRVRERNWHNLAPQSLQLVDRCFHGLPNFLVQSLAEILFGHTEPHAAHRLVEFGNVVRHGDIGRRGIHGITPGNRAQHNGRRPSPSLSAVQCGRAMTQTRSIHSGTRVRRSASIPPRRRTMLVDGSTRQCPSPTQPPPCRLLPRRPNRPKNLQARGAQRGHRGHDRGLL